MHAAAQANALKAPTHTHMWADLGVQLARLQCCTQQGPPSPSPPPSLAPPHLPLPPHWPHCHCSLPSPPPFAPGLPSDHAAGGRPLSSADGAGGGSYERLQQLADNDGPAVRGRGRKGWPNGFTLCRAVLLGPECIRGLGDLGSV